MGAVVTIGNFDGVHLGHRRLLERAVERARLTQTRSVALTFTPHPQVILKPDRVPELLTTSPERRELLLSTGVTDVIELEFTQELASTPPAQFFSEVLKKRLGLSELVVGHDFAFGKDRQGGMEELKRLCAATSIPFEVVPALVDGGAPISSTRIRAALLAGDVKSAARWLGRPYAYRGSVVRGDGRGRGLGFPTANLKVEPKLMVPLGVYASFWHEGGRRSPGVTNIGRRPTFEAAGSIAVETHVLDGGGDLYGREAKLELIERLRGEKKFESLDALKAQIARDCESARAILSIEAGGSA